MILSLQHCLFQRPSASSLSHILSFVFRRQYIPVGSSLRSRPSLSRTTIEELSTIRDLVIAKGLVADERLVGEVVQRCFDLGNADLPLSVFGVLANPSLFLQNLILRRLCDFGLYEQVLALYRRCVQDGCPSDAYTFPFVIKACSACYDVRVGREVHCVVLRCGYERNVVVQTALVDFYGKIGRPVIARKVFDRMPHHDLVSWNALISCYSLNSLDDEAFASVQKILAKDLKPNASTLASIIPICSHARRVDLGSSLHGYAIKSGMHVNETLVPALISMYARNSDVFSARYLFGSLPTNKDVIVWNSMIHAYAENSEPEKAYAFFKQMLFTDVQPNTASFVSVVPCCETLYSISGGECLHVCALKYGFENQVTVATVLITMYSKLRKVESSEILFALIQSRNLLTWNSMISGYVYNGIWDLALSSVGEMHYEGFYPDEVTVLGVLSACSKLEALSLGKSAHALIIRKGFDRKRNVSNALVALYSECHHLSLSIKIFERMDSRDSVSWNTLLSGCVYNQEMDRIEDLMWGMKQEGLQMDLVTLISILPSFKDEDDLLNGMAIHGAAVKRGYMIDVSLGNALISMYSSCGDLSAATLFFDAMPQRDLISWNSLITGYRFWNKQAEAMALLRQMMQQGMWPSNVTLLNGLRCCFSVLQGKSIHAYALRAGLVLETYVITSLILMYAQFRNIVSCLLLFNLGDKGSISLWNTMISSFVQTKQAQNAVYLFNELVQAELKPDPITMLEIISACIQINNIELANSVLVFTLKKGFINETIMANALIDLHSKCGDISTAADLFKHQHDRDEVTWSAMMNGYGIHGDGKAAFDLLLRMKNSGRKPDGIMYLTVLSACSHSGLIEQSKMAFEYMLSDGISPKTEHFACILDILGRTGNLIDAYNIVKKLPVGFPCTASMLESLLGACGLHGNIEIGEKIGKMVLEVFPTNSGAYVMLHNIYAGAGRWADAKRVRSDMEENEVRKVAGFTLLERSTG